MKSSRAMLLAALLVATPVVFAEETSTPTETTAPVAQAAPSTSKLALLATPFVFAATKATNVSDKITKLLYINALLEKVGLSEVNSFRVSRSFVAATTAYALYQAYQAYNDAQNVEDEADIFGADNL